ncbi:unnamed protein product, partial [Polarella glacialis]
VAMKENAQTAAGMSRKVTELHEVVASLRHERSGLSAKLLSASQIAQEQLSATVGPPQLDDLQEVPPELQWPLSTVVSVSGRETLTSDRALSPQVPDSLSPNKTSTRRSSGVKKVAAPLSFSVACAVQTDTDFIFDDGALLDDELDLIKYEYFMGTAYRIYALLCKYQWNTVSRCYTLRNEADIEQDSDGDVQPPTLPKGHKLGPRQMKSVGRLDLMRKMKQTVQKAQQQATMVQLEVECNLLVDVAHKGFEVWVAQLAKDHSAKKEAWELPIDPEQLFNAVKDLVNAEGMRRRIRELEDNMTQLLPMAEKASKAAGANGGADLGFWKRVLRTVRHNMATRRGSTFMKAQAMQLNQLSLAMNKSAQAPNAPGKLGNLPSLLGELALVWASLPPRMSAPGILILNRPLPQQALQETVKTFYLRKTGRTKSVEQAVANLCRAVLDHSQTAKVALFAVMCDIQPAATMGDRVPKVKRDVEMDLGVRLRPASLGEIPLDASHCIASFMRELKTLRRSRKFAGSASEGDLLENLNKKLTLASSDGEEAPDIHLPFQLVLAAGYSSIASRSQVAARSFWLMLFSFAEFPKPLIPPPTPKKRGSSERVHHK